MTNSRKFKPEKTNDHITLSVNLVVKIGSDEQKELITRAMFHAYMRNAAEIVGAEVHDIKSNVINSDTFCGSQREKFLYDAGLERY